MATITLVTGGARSGKSTIAERIVEGHSGTPIYIATAQARDDEMTSRIEQHKRRRPPGWRTIETVTDLAGALCESDGEGPRLVDCLTLWLSNLLTEDIEPEEQVRQMLDVLRQQSSPVVLVKNDVGFGIVPDNELARRFLDHVGLLNLHVAYIASDVIRVVAGQPLHL